METFIRGVSLLNRDFRPTFDLNLLISVDSGYYNMDLIYAKTLALLSASNWQKTYKMPPVGSRKHLMTSSEILELI